MTGAVVPALAVVHRRITAALKQLRIARGNGDEARELAWQVRLDWLLDHYPRRLR